MGKTMNAFAWADRMILGALKVVTIVSFVLLTILITANVYAYLVFYGAAALWILRGHISVGDWIEKSIGNPRRRHLYRMFLELMVLGFAAVFFYYSLRLTILALDVTNVFAIPKRILYSCMPVSGAIMVIYSLRNLAGEIVGALHDPTG